MRPSSRAFRLSAVPIVVLCALLFAGLDAHAQTDPLPSWNDGAAKKAIVDFVQATTDKASPKFVAPEARVALLDKNHDSFFEVWFGAAKANAVLVPVNWRLAPPEIAYVINDAQAAGQPEGRDDRANPYAA